MPPKRIEARHRDASIMRDSSELAAEAITNVLRAANTGELPIFAATLGMPASELAALPDLPVQVRIQRSRLRHDSPADSLPEAFPHLVGLLWDHRSRDDRRDWWLAHALACACFGRRHLWQDLGLGGREDVSQLISKHFSGLHARNTQNLKWKRFLFQELGIRLDRHDLKPPACDGCDNYRSCFS